MINYVQPGEVVTLTAPSGGVVTGGTYLIGSLVVVATHSAAETEKFSAFVGPGVVEVTKKNDSAWSEGEKIYWDDTEGNYQDSAGGNILVGVAAEAALQAAVVGKVRLDGVVR